MMTQFKFTIIFIIAITILLLLLDYFIGLEHISKFIVIVIIAAYYLGQYSARFQKK